MQYLNSLINKKISIDHYFYDLINVGWKYDLEESDLFVRLSKTFWSEGIKVSLIFEEFCCVPPAVEILKIEALRFYAFDVAKFPKRTIDSRCIVTVQKIQTFGNIIYQRSIYF